MSLKYQFFVKIMQVTTFACHIRNTYFIFITHQVPLSVSYKDKPAVGTAELYCSSKRKNMICLHDVILHFQKILLSFLSCPLIIIHFIILQFCIKKLFSNLCRDLQKPE